MTYKEFLLIPEDTIFLTGCCEDSENGINMTGLKKQLRWGAVKGYANDWCIYAHWETQSIEFVITQGDKVATETYIRRCVPCDDEMYLHYRR